MLAVIIVAGIAFALQGFFSFMQMKHLKAKLLLEENQADFTQAPS